MLLASKGRVSAGSCLYLFKRASYKVRLLQQSVHAGGMGKGLPTPALVEGTVTPTKLLCIETRHLK